MFRPALAYGNASTVQVVSTYPERVVNVYRSHYQFLGIAVGLTLIATALVSATFYGYWKLERSMTLNPRGACESIWLAVAGGCAFEWLGEWHCKGVRESGGEVRRNIDGWHAS